MVSTNKLHTLNYLDLIIYWMDFVCEKTKFKESEIGNLHPAVSQVSKCLQDLTDVNTPEDLSIQTYISNHQSSGDCTDIDNS